MAEQCCKNCKFWLEIKDNDPGVEAGECRRFPPQLIGFKAQMANGLYQGIFPETWGSEWCGEFAWTMKEPAKKPCIFCGSPRLGSRLDCGKPECWAKVLAMPTEELSKIRETEAIEAMRQAPADGRGAYFHFTPREDDKQ